MTASIRFLRTPSCPRRAVSAIRPIALALLLGLFAAATLTAQSPARTVDAGGPALATRAELEQLAADLATRVQSGGEARPASRAGGDSPASLRERLRAVETRLEQGDFRPGDVVEIFVRQDETLTGQFSVNRQVELEIPNIEPIDMRGVLLSETEQTVREALSVYIKDPDVRARPLRRIAVLGAVAEPGFYDVYPAASISDVLMMAGGPSTDSKLDKMQYRRDGENLLADRQGGVESLTLLDLGARRGDEIMVPGEKRGGGNLIRILGFSLGTATSVGFLATQL